MFSHTITHTHTHTCLRRVPVSLIHQCGLPVSWMDGWMDEREEESERESVCARVWGVWCFLPEQSVRPHVRALSSSMHPYTHNSERERDTEREVSSSQWEGDRDVYVRCASS